jgi:hypothetical protein
LASDANTSIAHDEMIKETEKVQKLLQILDNKEGALMDEIMARQDIEAGTWDDEEDEI